MGPWPPLGRTHVRHGIATRRHIERLGTVKQPHRFPRTNTRVLSEGVYLTVLDLMSGKYLIPGYFYPKSDDDSKKNPRYCLQ